MGNAKSSKANKPQSSRALGASLAVKMIGDLEKCSVRKRDTCFAAPADRKPGTAQWNVVLEHLDAINELTDDREAVAGFASILSDYIASAAAGCIPDADSYQLGADHAAL